MQYIEDGIDSFQSIMSDTVGSSEKGRSHYSVGESAWHVAHYGLGKLTAAGV